MAEAEDLITDAARYATVFVQDLWRRHRRGREPLDLAALFHRIDLFVTAAFGKQYGLRIAQPPPPRTLARKLFRRHEEPAARIAVPATDGVCIWLPAPPPDADERTAAASLRLMALQQAARAARGAPQRVVRNPDPLARAVGEVLEAHAADLQLVYRLAGVAPALSEQRRRALAERPPLDAFPAARRPLEQWVRGILQKPLEPSTPLDSDTLEDLARSIAAKLRTASHAADAVASLLYRDVWIGELRAPAPAQASASTQAAADEQDLPQNTSARSARLTRRPTVRKPDERDRRDAGSGVWMVQPESPHQHAEDPFGMQRPIDRDEDTAADSFADSLSELPEARLVTAPGSPPEVLISDDPPEAQAKLSACAGAAAGVFTYPEWDFRANAYRTPGAAVHVLHCSSGTHEWVERTLQEHRSLLRDVRRQFESLRTERTWLRQQEDGDELDLEACIDSFADARASGALDPSLYRRLRLMQHDLAVLLLIDVSGSTDSWIAQHRRVIDVEREALLLVCLALKSLGEPYGVLAFSGEGPAHVTVRSIKTFAERYSETVALRIAGLEPERYTRAGAAIRHAAALLMHQPARHRLLLMISDGKPNDADEYDGRYGVEDMRQAVIEARLQGVFPFCLTIDRHTSHYLPSVFGKGHYAILHRPERLPTALIGWLRRLVR